MIEIEILDMTAVAIALMIFLIALIYMSAQLFRRPEWEALAKVELYQVFVSILIVIFISGIANFANELSFSMAGGDPFTISYNYLNGMIFQKTLPAVIDLRLLSMHVQYMGGLYAKYGSGNWGVQFPMIPGMNAVESSIEFIINVLSPFSASLMVQQLGIQIIQGAMFQVVLPLGIFLRIFPQTREAGVFLIATAFGFYVVFPMTYVMHATVVSYMEAQAENSPSDWKGNAINYVELNVGASIVNTVITRTLFASIEKLSFTVMQAVFLPSISFILTTSFIKMTSKFISQKFD